MSTARSATPVATSDTSSDGGSLSDLDSGWTDLETTRSNGRHSPFAISEAGDNEDARNPMDDEELWKALTPECDEKGPSGEDTFRIESSSAATTSHPSSFLPEVSELTLEDWVADAVGSSLLSDDETSTPHMSFHRSSSPLRLSFPDPLSNSDHDLLPSHSLSRTRSQPTEGSPEVRNHSPARTESLSSVTARSASATTPSDTSFSVPDEDEEGGEEIDYVLPTVELASPPVSYALSIILLGHPPLPHLKRSTLSTVIDMVATVLNGSPRVLEGSDTARIHEVPIHVHQAKSAAGPEVTSTHRLIIEDRTSGMSPSSSFTSLHCPTLALVFIQPPLSSPNLPSLPFNTRYLPLLLPSISDGFASSLLDLSPSMLFEHSVADVPPPDNTAMKSLKSFALHQCDEMDIIENRLDGRRDVLTVEEFSQLPTDKISSALRQVLFPREVAAKQTPESYNTGTPSILTFRKPIVFISAFLFALLFGSTVFFRGSIHAAPQSTQQPSSSQGQKTWSFIHPFLNRMSNEQTPSHPASASSELSSSPPQPPMAASVKSLAVPTLPDSAEMPAASTATGQSPHPERSKGKAKQAGGIQVDDGRHEVRHFTIDAAAPHLTLDAPSPKSLSLLPQAARPNRAHGKDTEQAGGGRAGAHDPHPSATTCLSTRIAHALGPVFDRMQADLRELREAIDALLQALWRLQMEAAHGLGDLVYALSAQWRAGPGVHGIAGRVQRAARSVGRTAAGRHARARHNARKVRDIGERYVSAARQHLKEGVERARGNARTLKEGLAFRRPNSKGFRERRRAARKTRARAECTRRARCSEYVFESVMALVV